MSRGDNIDANGINLSRIERLFSGKLDDSDRTAIKAANAFIDALPPEGGPCDCVNCLAESTPARKAARRFLDDNDVTGFDRSICPATDDDARQYIEGATAEERKALGLPEDYEPCGYCGFDHEYESGPANVWHKEHPGEGYDP